MDTRVIPIIACLLGGLLLAGCSAEEPTRSGPPVIHPEQTPPAAEVTTTQASASAPIAQAEPMRLPSGVVTRDMTIGSGEPIPPGAVAEVNFVGMLASGEVFDSTERRKRTLIFDLASPGLIQGLREGIPGMRAGGKRRVEIPWKLAYGEHGRDPIPPRTDLVFEIELLRWTPAAKNAY